MEPMERKLTSNTNREYNIKIEKKSENIVFKLESEEIPKIISLNNYNFCDMKTNYPIFSSECYNSIDLIFKEIQNFIETSSPELIEENNKVKLMVHTSLKVSPDISFVFEKKIDIDETFNKINELFTNLKNEKDKEIKDLKKKSDEKLDNLEKKIINLKNEKDEVIKDLKKKSDERIDKLEKEIINLKNGMINIKKEHKKETDKLKKEVENLKEENQKINHHLNKISLDFI